MQKSATTKEQIFTPPTPDKDLQAARQVVNIFIQAWKNYGLYPEDHANTKRSLENLVDAFNTFLSDHEELRISVEKDRLLWESEIIYTAPADASSDDIITLLYRDGIKWIEFQEGLSLEEIAAFFKISFKYRSFGEEADGDIVTALTDEELEFIDFKAVDVFWQDQLLMDFSKLPPPAPQSGRGKQQEKSGQPEAQGEPEDENVIAGSIALVSEDQLELSNLDYVTLQQMVHEEENWVLAEDLVEALLIILKSQGEQEKFEAVLGFIAVETGEILEKDRFDLLALLLRSLRKLFAPESATVPEWQKTRVDEFFRELSTPDNFQRISDSLLQLETIKVDKLKELAQTLLYFSPDLIPYLVPVILHSSSPEIQQMVSVVITHLSRQDIGPLEKLVDQFGSEMGSRLLDILNNLQGERINRILFKMCEHPSEVVRRKAIMELIGRDPRYARKLFSLIEDPSKGVRTSILTAFARQRSKVPEQMLLNYVQENTTKKDSDQVRACFKALGRCGSDLSVPFLRELLLSRGWNSFIGSGKLFYRECAAIALALLDSPEAKAVLLEASGSKYKVVRAAFDGAKKTIRDVEGGRSDV